MSDVVNISIEVPEQPTIEIAAVGPQGPAGGGSSSWSDIEDKPTTLAGYGITDGITSANVAAGYQPLDADLTAIAALSGTSGFLKKTGANTWTLDTATYASSSDLANLVSFSTDQSGSKTNAEKAVALKNVGFNTSRTTGALNFVFGVNGTGFDVFSFSSIDTGVDNFGTAWFNVTAEEGVLFQHNSTLIQVIDLGTGSINFTDASGRVFALENSKLVYDKTISPTADSTEVATTAWVNDLVAPRTFTFRFDGAGSAITTGAKKVYFRVPFACTITGWEIAADVSGSIVFDIWKDTYANYPPTVADSITASAKPTLTTATKSQGSTLTGWTTSLSAGDYIEINVDSASTVTVAMLTLTVNKV